MQTPSGLADRSAAPGKTSQQASRLSSLFSAFIFWGRLSLLVILTAGASSHSAEQAAPGALIAVRSIQHELIGDSAPAARRGCPRVQGACAQREAAPFSSNIQAP
jgi:hypothetical protein